MSTYSSKKRIIDLVDENTDPVIKKQIKPDPNNTNNTTATAAVAVVNEFDSSSEHAAKTLESLINDHKYKTGNAVHVEESENNANNNDSNQQINNEQSANSNNNDMLLLYNLPDSNYQATLDNATTVLKSVDMCWKSQVWKKYRFEPIEGHFWIKDLTDVKKNRKRQDYNIYCLRCNEMIRSFSVSKGSSKYFREHLKKKHGIDPDQEGWVKLNDFKFPVENGQYLELSEQDKLKHKSKTLDLLSDFFIEQKISSSAIESSSFTQLAKFLGIMNPENPVYAISEEIQERINSKNSIIG